MLVVRREPSFPQVARKPSPEGRTPPAGVGYRRKLFSDPRLGGNEQLRRGRGLAEVKHRFPGNVAAEHRNHDGRWQQVPSYLRDEDTATRDSTRVCAQSLPRLSHSGGTDCWLPPGDTSMTIEHLCQTKGETPSVAFQSANTERTASICQRV